MVRFALALPGLLLLSSCAADISADHTDRRTPLEGAAAEGKIDEIRRMLASGSDPNAHGGTWTWPLEAAAERPHNSEVIRALLAAGANPNPVAQQKHSSRRAAQIYLRFPRSTKITRRRHDPD